MLFRKKVYESKSHLVRQHSSENKFTIKFTGNLWEFTFREAINPSARIRVHPREAVLSVYFNANYRKLLVNWLSAFLTIASATSMRASRCLLLRLGFSKIILATRSEMNLRLNLRTIYDNLRSAKR